MLPPEENPKYPRLCQHYIQLSEHVVNALEQIVDSSKLPRAAMALQTYLTKPGITDGFVALIRIIATNVTSCGALKDDDHEMQLKDYTPTPGATLIQVVADITSIKKDAINNGIVLPRNCALKAFIEALNTDPAYRQVIQMETRELTRLECIGKKNDPVMIDDQEVTIHSIASILTITKHNTTSNTHKGPEKKRTKTDASQSWVGHAPWANGQNQAFYFWSRSF